MSCHLHTVDSSICTIELHALSFMECEYKGNTLFETSQKTRVHVHISH